MILATKIQFLYIMIKKRKPNANYYWCKIVLKILGLYSMSVFIGCKFFEDCT